MRTEKERLLSALTQLNNILELTRDNEDRDFIVDRLSSVESELNRQLFHLISHERKGVER
tara:strand:- start:1270 stop:1449 length:180 start_codon:yes stop_codon:yes gene_type:complete